MDYPTLYHCCVHQRQELQNIKLIDSFKLETKASIRYYLPTNDPNSDPLIIETIPLFQTTITLPCKHIFQINRKYFLQWYLANSLYETLLTYGSPRYIENVSCEIIGQLRRLYFPHASNHQLTQSSNSTGESFDFDLNIIIDMPLDTSDEELVMQEDVKMVPASEKAIQSLKTYKLPQHCQICLEKFYEEKEDEDEDDDVEITAMPCGHMFHHHCIIQWLKTSHMCPLCRCALSTDKKRKR